MDKFLDLTGLTEYDQLIKNYVDNKSGSNAFDSVTVNSTTISATATNKNLNFVAGDNITITPDADTNGITISSSGGSSYTLPVATSSALGGIKSGTDITVDSSGNVSVNDDSHNHVISNVDGLQDTLNAKLQLQSDTGLEVGKYIDFHSTDGTDFDARLLAESNKLNCYGYFYCSDRVDAGGKATLFTDGEGGSVELISPDGSLGIQMDLYNNDVFRIYVYETNPWAYKNEIVLNRNGEITSSGVQLRPIAYQSSEPSASIPGMIWIG